MSTSSPSDTSITLAPLHRVTFTVTLHPEQPHAETRQHVFSLRSRVPEHVEDFISARLWDLSLRYESCSSKQFTYQLDALTS